MPTSLPFPEPGLVVSYSYLWGHEHEQGHEEGHKARPCVIVLAVEQQDDKTIVTLAPITHTPPRQEGDALEIPLRVKQHIGLDDERSWVVLTEVNQFTWPGYDLQPHDGDDYAYGFLPPRFFQRIQNGILEAIVKRKARITHRD